MAFERKSMEQILQRMVDWTRGSTTKLTDFRVGSRIRTIYESVAFVMEEFYDKVHRTIKKLIEENIYSVLGFSKRPAIHASGIVVFSRSTPADTNYIISAGTVVRTGSYEARPPVEFRTTQDVVLEEGKTSVEAPVVCQTAGVIGNVEANSIVEFVTKPAGVDFVTNPSAFNNGMDEETPDEQKVRFQNFVQSLSRGTLAAIEYGASLAEIKDTDGTVIERVRSSKAFEILPDRKGEVDVYIWNGIGQASQELINEAKKIIEGYYTSEGEPVFGYKPGGIIVNIYSAIPKHVTIKLAITPEFGYDLDEDIKPYVEREIDDFFSSFKLGQTLIQTALETRVKLVAGVEDVKVYLSLDDGQTFTQDNLTAEDTEIFLPKKPLIYE